MELIQLTSDYEMKPFDCGDAVLNGFLRDKAKSFMENRLAKTYLFCDGNNIVGYFSLLNDKLSRQEVTSSDWRKIKKLFPHEKHMGSYPAVKIGRFAVSLNYSGCGIGSRLLDLVAQCLLSDPGYSMFRFLTVDAYVGAVPFYERNGFRRLAPSQEQGDTQTMYFDIKSVMEP